MMTTLPELEEIIDDQESLKKQVQDYANEVDSLLTKVLEAFKQIGEKKAIGGGYEMTKDFKEILRSEFFENTLLTHPPPTHPHPEGPAAVDPIVYEISSHQREPTKDEKREFSLFSKMVFPHYLQDSDIVPPLRHDLILQNSKYKTPDVKLSFK
ncbi:MAG TPA: hypothetical protein VFP45_03450 [Candidatus Nitrosotalea sp.]|nr:hypothetical protein [Candidatus Nitrosotalea sp.]